MNDGKNYRDMEIDEARPNSTPAVPPPPEITEKLVVNLSERFIETLEEGIKKGEITRSHISLKLKQLKDLASLEAHSNISGVAFHLYMTYCEIDGGENPAQLKECVPMALERARISLCSRTNMPRIPRTEETNNSTIDLRHLLILFLNKAIKEKKLTEDELSLRLAAINTYPQLIEDAASADGHPILTEMVRICEEFKAQNGDGDYVNLALLSLNTAYPVRRILK